MNVENFVGLIGAAVLLSAYGLLQLGRFEVNDGRYAFLNIVGTLAILYSLIAEFKYPSFVMYLCWLAFTVIGYLRSRSKSSS